ncbi:hypothetical protein AKO1_010577 [Acrasis kona]|uniref:Uncharacterized protein n=1 Tax=Acrasis kona TaxID=1008807 RepID=A0AAW2ZLC6_9EUKA
MWLIGRNEADTTPISNKIVVCSSAADSHLRLNIAATLRGAFTFTLIESLSGDEGFYDKKGTSNLVLLTVNYGQNLRLGLDGIKAGSYAKEVKAAENIAGSGKVILLVSHMHKNTSFYEKHSGFSYLDIEGTKMTQVDVELIRSEYQKITRCQSVDMKQIPLEYRPTIIFDDYSNLILWPSNDLFSIEIEQIDCFRLHFSAQIKHRQIDIDELSKSEAADFINKAIELNQQNNTSSLKQHFMLDFSIIAPYKMREIPMTKSTAVVMEISFP